LRITGKLFLNDITEDTKMISDNQMLNYIRQITEMGETGIDSVLDKTHDAAMRQSLQKQKEEYQRIYRSADRMLEERGGKEKDLNPMAELGSEISAMFQLAMDSSSSKIAEMMIKGNTMGVTKILQHMSDYQNGDERINDLANKLLQTQQNNIEQMKPYL